MKFNVDAIQWVKEKWLDENYNFTTRIHQWEDGRCLSKIYDGLILTMPDHTLILSTGRCEWVYIIDLIENKLKIYFHGQPIVKEKFKKLDIDRLKAIKEKLIFIPPWNSWERNI